MTARYERRLAAVLCADVVGYTKLMAVDEQATIESLKECQQCFARSSESHGGRVVNYAGDFVLAIFPSAVECVRCAVAVQDELRDRNQQRPTHRMEFRIGLHLGDLAVEDDTVYGNGVNIAARLQTLAAPSGICLSEAILEQVRHHLSLHLESLGPQHVKNVSEPITAYRIHRAGEAKSDASAVSPDTGSEAPPLFERPAIAVLPFDNLTGDPRQEYFADGLCEDLITQLSLFRFLPVIARNSSFQFKGRPVDAKQVQRELGALYMVEGSVRLSNNRVRVSAQLIDTSSGHHVWAERYDREQAEIFSVQDDITERIAASIHCQLSYAEPQRFVRRSHPSLDAWGLAQRGWWHANRRTRDDNRRSQELFRAAIERDPDFVWAAYGLVVSLSFDIFYQWTGDLPATALELMQVSHTCMRLDSNDPHALLAMSIGQAISGQLRPAIQAAERAVEISPSLAFGHYLLGFHLSVGGDAQRALAAVHRAIWLSPRDPVLWVYLAAEAGSHFALEDHERVIETCERVLRLRPDFPTAYGLLTASCVGLGRVPEAQRHLAAMLRAQPEFTANGFRASFRGAKPEVIERLIQGLVEAGLPADRT